MILKNDIKNDTKIIKMIKFHINSILCILRSLFYVSGDISFLFERARYVSLGRFLYTWLPFGIIVAICVVISVFAR